MRVGAMRKIWRNNNIYERVETRERRTGRGRPRALRHVGACVDGYLVAVRLGTAAAAASPADRSSGAQGLRSFLRVGESAHAGRRQRVAGSGQRAAVGERRRRASRSAPHVRTSAQRDTHTRLRRAPLDPSRRTREASRESPPRTPFATSAFAIRRSGLGTRVPFPFGKRD